MKPRLGMIIAATLALLLVVSGCVTPTPTPVPAPAAAPAQATAAPAPTQAPAGKIVIATDAAFPPMEFVDENKNIVGFDIDMMNAIADVMGLEIEYKNTAWDGIFAGLESGDYDAILSAVTIRDDRKEKYDFSDPYINAGQAVVVRMDEAAIASHEDLSGKTVGAQIGTTGAFAVQEISGATLKEYDTIDLAFMDLIGGNIDAVVVDTPIAADYALASDQFKGKLKIVGEAFTDEQYGLLVVKGQMGDLLQAFNEGLKRIQADGTYDEIYAKWISGGAMASPIAAGGAGPAVPPAPGFPVKLAIVVPLSGDVKTFGESTRDGAMMAFDEAEAAGWDIEVVLADSKCDAQEAANAANKVIFEDEVKYIVGEVCSSASIPISEIAEANQVLQISPTSTNPVVTVNEDGSTKEYVFRACFLDPFQGEVVAALAQELGASKAAVLYDVGNDYVKGLAEYFKASFESMGGTVPVYEAYTKDDTDFSAVLGKVAAADVDVLFLPDYYAKNNLIAAQVKEKGIDATLLGGDGWDSPELQFDLFEGGYHSNHYSPADPRPLVQNFVSAYEAKYGMVPDALATLAYDAAGILLQSIAEAGVDDPTLVKDVMAAIQYEGVSGDITYDEKHNPVKKAAIVKIEGGKPTFYKFVAP
ncbi:MAG: transporter substrate-binding domain-containing protein [Anaerolineae bacterium]|nr:transporter substrate-binding domain-containing protein [Anaerolineae bacterium]